MTDEWAEWRQEIGESADEMRADNARRAQEVISVKESSVVDDIPAEVEAEERALIVSQPQAPQQHLVTGMAALAQMDEGEFQKMMAAIKTGQERMAAFQKQVMVKGEDYGTVKGIDRPFLHLPGAEKMTLLYGFAVEQRAERIIGTKRKVVVGDVTVEEFDSPPLSYHVKSYVHLGSFDGPIVAMGYGEASSWEVKYRYSWAKAKCPKCGREGLIRGKADGKLKGKWWCPSREGGCNATFEPAATNEDGSLVVTPPGKVENTDPWSLAETLIQMAAKRSFVAATRRATGTSGLFTQDDDSPSVQQQADTSGDGDENPPVENVTGQQQVERGGKPTGPTPQQIAQLTKLSKEKDLGPDRIAAVITRLFDVPLVLPDGTRGEKGKALLAYIEKGLTADQFGQLLHSIDTGDITAATAPGKATD